jgi:hypothetical protein
MAAKVFYVRAAVLEDRVKEVGYASLALWSFHQLEIDGLMQALLEVAAMPVARQALVLKMGHSLRAVHLQRIEMNGVAAGSGSSNQIEPEVPLAHTAIQPVAQVGSKLPLVDAWPAHH